MDDSRLFGVRISTTALEPMIDELSTPLSASSPARIVATMNLDHVVKLRNDDRFRTAYKSAERVTADGMPIVAYAKLRGSPVPKVSGSDLFAELIPRLDASRHRCYFIVSNAMVSRRLCERLAGRGFAADRMGFIVPPFGFENDPELGRAIARDVESFRPTHVFVCVGAPKSEIWSHEAKECLRGAHVLCLGASAEFFLGTKRRAPIALQRIGLEWLWRWAHEPRRLFHRYFIASWGFIGAIRDDLIRNSQRHPQ